AGVHEGESDPAASGLRRRAPTGANARQKHQTAEGIRRIEGYHALMAETTYATQRAQLTAERERVADQLKELGVDRSSFDDGFADSGQVTAERGEVQALVGSLREALQDIDDALDKIELGAYGQCESCGRDIADARLEAMPAARLCISCAAPKRR